MKTYFTLILYISLWACTESKTNTIKNNFYSKTLQPDEKASAIWTKFRQEVINSGTTIASRAPNGLQAYTKKDAEIMEIYTLPLLELNINALEADTNCYDIIQYCFPAKNEILFVGKKKNRVITTVTARRINDTTWIPSITLAQPGGFEQSYAWLPDAMKKHEADNYDIISINHLHFIAIPTKKGTVYYSPRGKAQTDILNYVNFVLQNRK